MNKLLAFLQFDGMDKRDNKASGGEAVELADQTLSPHMDQLELMCAPQVHPAVVRYELLGWSGRSQVEPRWQENDGILRKKEAVSPCVCGPTLAQPEITGLHFPPERLAEAGQGGRILGWGFTFLTPEPDYGS